MTSPEPTSPAAWAAHLPPGMAEAEVDLVAAGNLPRAFARRWSTDEGMPVVHDDATGWVSAAELEARTRRVAARYTAAGLQPGDRILLSASPSVDVVVAHVGALRAGLVVVPANTAYLEREVAHVVRDARPAAAVVDARDRGRWVESASTSPVLVTSPHVDLPDGPDPAHLDAAATGDPAVIAYTSGTTGSPKGAVLSHGNLLASAEALALAWRWTPADRLVLSLPLFHLHGLGVGLHGTLVAGASVAVRPSFAVDDVLDAIAAVDGTLFFGVPTMWSRLAASSRVGELARLRLGVSGSAPLPAALHEQLAHAGGQRLIERYGMTETVMNVSTPYDGERRAGTVGLPLPGVEVRLDPVAGSDGGAGAAGHGGDRSDRTDGSDDTDPIDGTGEILLRGPNVFAGYWERPEATAGAFRDGWFATGDLGAFDPDGYLRIVGRRTELIITGGYNVYPREVEDVLRTHPAVGDVAVVGVPDAEWGERVVAVAERSATSAGVGSDSTDADAVLAHGAAQLAAYKRPKRLVWVDALPRNALGKVTKSEVARLLE